MGPYNTGFDQFGNALPTPQQMVNPMQQPMAANPNLSQAQTQQMFKNQLLAQILMNQSQQGDPSGGQ